MQPLFSFFILDFRVDFAEFKSILLICYYFTYNLLFLDLFVLFEIIYEFFFFNFTHLIFLHFKFGPHYFN
jgi:hypothetical protein